MAAAASIGLIGCGSRGSRYRQRITVEVETPEGLKTGSSVSEVRWGYSDAFGELGGSSASARGQAVAVDLPGGQTLFALLQGEKDANWLEFAAGYAVGDQIPPEEKRKGDYLDDHHLAGEFEPERYPMLVRFRDIRDPSTVELVNPTNLESAFGPGVRLKRITLQITDEPISDDIRSKIPWWETYLDRHFDGSQASIVYAGTNSLAARLSSGSFSTEFR